MAKNWLKPNGKYVNKRNASKKPFKRIEIKIDAEEKGETIRIIQEMAKQHEACHLVFLVKSIDVYMMKNHRHLISKKNTIEIQLHKMGLYTSNEKYIY